MGALVCCWFGGCPTETTWMDVYDKKKRKCLIEYTSLHSTSPIITQQSIGESTIKISSVGVSSDHDLIKSLPKVEYFVKGSHL